jgi:hypothetical protein
MRKDSNKIMNESGDITTDNTEIWRIKETATINYTLTN